MKKLLFLVCCIFPQLNNLAFSRSDSTPAMQMCRTIEIALYEDFILPGKSLPASFEDMPFLRECAEHQWADRPHEFDRLNDLAIVPNAPAIKNEQGISANRAGSRLFAISRTWNFDYSRKGFDESDPMSGGRFVILISENPLSVAPSWIPEQEARVIISQVNGFDPAIQPRSFNDFAKNARSKVIERDAHKENMRKIWADSTRPNRHRKDGPVKILGNHRELWIIGACIVGSLLILHMIRRGLKSKANL